MWKALVSDATKRQKMCETQGKNPNYSRYLMEESSTKFKDPPTDGSGDKGYVTNNKYPRNY